MLSLFCKTIFIDTYLYERLSKKLLKLFLNKLYTLLNADQVLKDIITS